MSWMKYQTADDALKLIKQFATDPNCQASTEPIFCSSEFKLAVQEWDPMVWIGRLGLSPKHEKTAKDFVMSSKDFLDSKVINRTDYLTLALECWRPFSYYPPEDPCINQLQ